MENGKYRKLTVRFSTVLIVAALFLVSVGCDKKNVVNPRLDDEMPRKILWAWERPQDLSFIDTNEFGVAFLAQTIFLENDRVIPKPRRQPLEIAPKTYLIAVTRIETNKDGGKRPIETKDKSKKFTESNKVMSKRPTFDDEMIEKTASLIKSTLDLPDVRAIQVDFDAVVSERAFYRRMMNELAKGIGTRDKGQGQDQSSTNTRPSSLAPVPLLMTALASWCTGDAWFNDFPVDEAVPMVFQMGSDSDKIKTFLRNGNDWNEPLCRGSYGISIEETNFEGIKNERRIYYFKNSSWNIADLNRLK